jgi:hypothetical protein
LETSPLVIAIVTEDPNTLTRDNIALGIEKIVDSVTINAIAASYRLEERIVE